MFKQTISMPRLLAGLVLMAAAFAASANSISYTINFDSLNSGDNPNLDPVAMARGVTFSSGQLKADLDSDGYPILDPSGNLDPLHAHWEAISGVSLAVSNPSIVGYGPAPSPNYSLNGLLDEILVQFVQPTLLNGFSVGMATGGHGGPFPVHLSFLDANGKTLFDSADYMQNITTGIGRGFSPTYVSSIWLPGNVFYDNVTLSAVPAPATLWLIGPGVLAMFRLNRRKA